MNKKELAASVSDITGLKIKDCITVINALTEVIKSEVSTGSKIQLIGFGTFGSRLRQERIIYNPQTKESIPAEAKAAPYFKPSKIFKDEVNTNQI